jgi:hypothetical protein
VRRLRASGFKCVRCLELTKRDNKTAWILFDSQDNYEFKIIRFDGEGSLNYVGGELAKYELIYCGHVSSGERRVTVHPSSIAHIYM